MAAFLFNYFDDSVLECKKLENISYPERNGCRQFLQRDRMNEQKIPSMNIPYYILYCLCLSFMVFGGHTSQPTFDIFKMIFMITVHDSIGEHVEAANVNKVSLVTIGS